MVKAISCIVGRSQRWKHRNAVLYCFCYCYCYFIWMIQTTFEVGFVTADGQKTSTLPQTNHNIFIRKPYANNYINIQQQNPALTLSVTDSNQIESSISNNSSGNILVYADNRKGINNSNDNGKKSTSSKTKKCKTRKIGGMSMDSNKSNNNDILFCPPIEEISPSPSTTTFLPTTTHRPTISSTTITPTVSSTTSNGKGKTVKTKVPFIPTTPTKSPSIGSMGNGMSKNNNGKKGKRPIIPTTIAPIILNIPTLAPIITTATNVPVPILTTTAVPNPIGMTTTPPIIVTPPSSPTTGQPQQVSIPTLTSAPITAGTITPTITSLPPSLAAISISPSLPTPAPTVTKVTPTVTASGAPATTNPTVAPNHQRQYDITLNFDSASVPDSDQIDFITAAQRWESIITGDVEDMQTTDLVGASPEVPGCSFPTDFIDDLYLCIYYQQITTGAIGIGGYTYLRSSNGLPVIGFARIDPNAIADARAFGYFTGLLLHEMGHAIGLGTLDICPTNDINSNANREYQQISQCTTTIPMDPVASDCGHYSEDCLQNELMTPTIGPTSNPLSRITIGWCEDFGYQVDYTQADPYTSANLGTIAGCNCNRRSRGRNRHLHSDNKKLPDHRSALDNTNVRYSGQLSDFGHPNNTTRMVQQTKQSSSKKLSDEGYNRAFAYGYQYLEEQYTKHQQQQASHRPNNVSTGNVSPNVARYVGDKLVWIYYREGDAIHSVLVRR